MASVTITYILWLCGGILGLHHVYLRRERQAFIWWATWGGMVLGWLGEVTRIREYVDEANRAERWRKQMADVRKKSPTPEFNFGFLAGQFMIGHQLANLLISAVPDVYIDGTIYGPYLAHILAALGSSIGVHLVANIGPQQAPFLPPFLVSCLSTPLAFFLCTKPRPLTILLCTVIAAYFSSEHASWRDIDGKQESGYKDVLQRLGVLFLALTVYSGLWSSNLYFNFKINMLNGTQVRFKDTAYNFLQTQPWEGAVTAMNDMYPCLRMYGWEPCQQHVLSTLVDISDPHREAWALHVLGFEGQPSPKKIHSHCRRISSKFHPDKFTQAEQAEKDEAARQFADIQKACGMLDVIKRDRERKSKWSFSPKLQSEMTEDVDNVESDNYNADNDDDEYGDVDNENRPDSNSNIDDDSECSGENKEDCNSHEHKDDDIEDDSDCSGDYNEYDSHENSDDDNDFLDFDDYFAGADANIDCHGEFDKGCDSSEDGDDDSDDVNPDYDEFADETSDNECEEKVLRKRKTASADTGATSGINDEL